MKDLLLCVHAVVETFKFRNFTLSFGRLRQRIVLKCVPHVQHDYFFAFNHSMIQPIRSLFSGVVPATAVALKIGSFSNDNRTKD